MPESVIIPFFHFFAGLSAEMVHSLRFLSSVSPPIYGVECIWSNFSGNGIRLWLDNLRSINADHVGHRDLCDFCISFWLAIRKNWIKPYC